MENIKRINKIMLRYWGYLLFGIIFMLGFAAFSGFSIALIKPMLDYVFKKPDSITILYSDFPSLLAAVKTIFTDSFQTSENLLTGFRVLSSADSIEKINNIFAQTDSFFLLYFLSAMFIIIVLLKNVFFFGKKVMFANLRGKAVADIRNMIFRKYLFQALSFFNKNLVGDSLVRVTSDVTIIGRMYINSIFIVLQNLALILIFAAMALFFNAKLFLYSLLLVPVFGIVLNILGNKIKKYSKRLQTQYSKIFSNLEEILSNIRIVKAFAREESQYKKFKTINTKHLGFWKRSVIYSAVSVPLSEISSTVMVAVVLILGGKQVLSPESSFTFGSFMTFLMAIFSMLHPLKILSKHYAEIRKAMVSISRVSEILNRSREIEECGNPIEKHNLTKDINLKDVSFEYEKGKTILSDINLTIKKGEKIALVGNSGSGKTTLINLLSRMYDVTSGEIFIDDVPVKQLKLQDLRTLFGTVTQESILFNVSIAENIRYGSLNDLSKIDIEEAAKIAYADEFIDKLPGKYNEVIQPKASNLSGGQKQRLCIARAIAGNPPVLIFDEATSALDTEAERKVQKAIEQATKNRTVIVIAHRLSTILNSDKIIVMKEGRIIEQGTHKELMKSDSKYKEYYNMQFEEMK